MNKVTFFLPTRKGSQRVKDKNTRCFAGIDGGLLENKLLQLMQANYIDEIILSTNDEQCISIAKDIVGQNDKFKIIPRPEKLCLDSTNLQDLIDYVPTITNADHILWGHVTTPIADACVYDDAIRTYLANLSHNYDSLVSVTPFRNFLLNKSGTLINNTTAFSWPRTQDLEELYEINHVIFLATRTVYEKKHDRIGNNPFLYMMNKIQAFDIDWEEDFNIAEMIYKNKNK